MFHPCGRVAAFDTFDQTATDWPLGFAMWARARRREIAHDVCLSFSRTVGGDVWMPLEPSGAAWLSRARRTMGAKSLAIAVGRHHGALRAWATEAFFGGPREGARRVVATGGTSAGEASRSLHRVRGLGDHVLRVDLFAMVSPPSGEEIGRMRAAARAALGIHEAERVVLVSAPSPVGATLDPLLDAARETSPRSADGGIVLLVLAKDCFALHARALRRNAERDVRIVGLTECIVSALAAADVVALPHKAEGGVFAAGSVARLAADALTFGRPVLALSGAAGYGAARLRSSADDSPGIVVDGTGSEAWGRAFRQVADEGWLARASAAAREIGASMTFDRFAARLEEVLTEAAAERAAEMARV
jgi:hypothetical protein